MSDHAIPQHIVTVSRVPAMHPDLTEGRMRNWLRHRKANGLEKAGILVVTNGTAWCDVPRLLAWVMSGDLQAATPQASPPRLRSAKPKAKAKRGRRAGEARAAA